MQELRIALTVLPVGQRGQAVIQKANDEAKPLWFALQIAAGFAEPEDVSAIHDLWPWVLHVVKSGKVELDAWSGATQLSLTAEVPSDSFAQNLQKAITDTYAEAEARRDLDVRLLRPADGGKDVEYQRSNFPARVQYLATLPGELSSRLLATLYVPIKVTDLFVKNGNQWEPKSPTLFMAPKAVKRSAEIALNGPPVTVDGFLSVNGTDSGLPIIAFGPGFELERFTNPQSTVFDLKTYDVPVALGDRRYVELESLVLDVLDPFADLDQLRARDGRESVELVDPLAGTRRVVPQETFDSLVDMWRVRTLASELVAAFPDALRELVRLLVPTNTPVITIPERWGAGLAAELATSEVLVLAEKLAARIGIEKADPRTTLRRVAARSGFALIATLVAQAMDEISSGSDTPLTNAWNFGHLTYSPEFPARRRALALAALSEVREGRLVPPLFASLAGGALPSNAGTMLRDALKAKIALEWPARRERVVVAALESLGLASKEELLLEFGPNLAVEQAAAHVDMVWPVASSARPELPGRGLSLLVGAEAQRVVHEDNQDADDQRSPYREVSGVLLFARRGRDAEDLKKREWRLVTGGTAFIGDLQRRVFAPGQKPEIKDEEWLQALLPLPLRPVFQQKVARADLEYHGQPMLAHSALDQAYGAEDYEADAETMSGLPAAYSFQSLGNFETKVGDAAIASRAPALRYGDVYEFRARLIDQAGGLASDVADRAKPWQVNLKFPLEPKDPANIVRYRRAVPVGDLNVLPGKGDVARREDWPALPNDIALRAREWWGLTHDGGENLPALLFNGSNLAGTLDRYEFRIMPPVIDEHTLMRWAMPALDDANRLAILADLKLALSALLKARAVEESLQLHDPAVTKLGIRVTGAGADNRITEVLKNEVIALADIEGKPYQRPSIAVRIKAATFGAAPTATADATGVEIVIPEGSFASLEVFPLVTKSDFDSRFVAFEDLTDANARFDDHVAFRPSVLLLEGATGALPDEKALYKGLQLAEQNGQVSVRFDGDEGIENLVFVDRFAIERERWVWRNLPIFAGKLPADPGERRRLAASGPPKDVFDSAKRDLAASDAIANWERLAALDRGFADRGEIGGLWPRVAPASELVAGGPGYRVLLALDNRDAVSAADYLRFGLRVRSRYAGVLPTKERQAREISGSIRRRIATGFRGSKLKPPKILAIVPLTASIERDPLETPVGVPPFLILLDETFFREYGVGERLDLHLALENLDFHEKAENATLPYRTGPLPDHWLPRKPVGSDDRYYRGKVVTVAQDESAPIELDLFGPFGYSLDVTPSEALANASAFVAYPPRDAGPHWAMFVRLRRVLDLPSAGQRSDWSDTHALYTLPDVRLLATKTDGDTASLDLVGAKATLRGLRFILDPTATPKADENALLKNSEAASQYRYFLLVSRVVGGAGQGFDAELPLGLWRIPSAAAGYQQPETFVVEHRSGAEFAVAPLLQDDHTAPVLESGGAYRGRVLEVLLNGRYEGPSRIDGISKWRTFWESLLEDKAADEQDAAGMIRRVSNAFSVGVP